MEIRIYDKKNKKYLDQKISIAHLEDYLKKPQGFYIWIEANFKEKGYQTLLKKLTINEHIRHFLTKLNGKPHFQHDEHVLFSILYLPYFQDNHTMKTEEINFILTNHILLTTTKEPNDLLNDIIIKVKDQDELKQGPSHLMGYLVNQLCLKYYPMVDNLEDQAEILERWQLEEKRETLLDDIKKVKYSTIYLKRHVVHQRTMLAQIIDSPINQIKDKTIFEEAHKKITNISQEIEDIDKLLNGLLDTNLTITAAKTNQIMKVLALVSAIFLPLSFLTSWYGMNFRMPEVYYPHTYFIFMVITLGIFIIMITIFKKKHWI